MGERARVLCATAGCLVFGAAVGAGVLAVVYAATVHRYYGGLR